MNLHLEFKVNGAILLPNEGQYNAIKDFAYATIFGNGPSLPQVNVAAKKAGRPKGSKNVRGLRPRWLADEEAFVINRRAEGQSFKGISRELNRIFARSRTRKALEQYYYKHLKDRAVTLVDAGQVAPGQVSPALKPLEFGGTEGLKAHAVA